LHIAKTGKNLAKKQREFNFQIQISIVKQSPERKVFAETCRVKVGGHLCTKGRQDSHKSRHLLKTVVSRCSVEEKRKPVVIDFIAREITFNHC
jgi:hypothetical protein